MTTLLFFPSGAIYPTEGFSFWLKWISVVDPFTYAVHAPKNLLLKNAGFEGIYFDVLVLLGFSVVLMSTCIALFKRQIRGRHLWPCSIPPPKSRGRNCAGT